MFVFDPQVFRFGVAIASVANAVISILKGETRPLLGNLALSDSRSAQVGENVFFSETFTRACVRVQVSGGDALWVHRVIAVVSNVRRGRRMDALPLFFS